MLVLNFIVLLFLNLNSLLFIRSSIFYKISNQIIYPTAFIFYFDIIKICTLIFNVCFSYCHILSFQYLIKKSFLPNKAVQKSHMLHNVLLSSYLYFIGYSYVFLYLLNHTFLIFQMV